MMNCHSEEKATKLQTSNGPVTVLEIKDLPESCRGLVLERDGRHLVAINVNATQEEQARAFLHEMVHVVRGHCSGEMSVKQCELEADQETAFLFDSWKEEREATREEIELLEQWFAIRCTVPLQNDEVLV